MAKKLILKMAAAAILNFKNFNFWSLSSGSLSAVVYQILIKLENFSLRYGDLAIFKMSAVRHLGFVMTSQYCIAGHIFVVRMVGGQILGFSIDSHCRPYNNFSLRYGDLTIFKMAAVHHLGF